MLITTRAKTILAEAASKSLSRIRQHTQDRNIGMISAHRGEHTPEENKQRTAELASDIKAGGFGHVHVKGRYIENHGSENARPVDEHSFLVIGKKGDDGGALKGFLKKHGEKYKQDSVLHKPHNSTTASLHGTSHREDSFPGHGKVHDVGEFKPQRAGEFHSVMKSRKTFAFENVHFYNQVSFSNREETLF
jgi:hypothetical protein